MHPARRDGGQYAGKHASARNEDTMPSRSALVPDRACCCPARPVVSVLIPPSATRRHSVDLLLCGHHYRVSRQALNAARALVTELPGPEEGHATALFPAVTVPCQRAR